MQQSWQGETVRVGGGTHHPQSLCASPPEAVLPAERQAAVQAWAATQANSILQGSSHEQTEQASKLCGETKHERLARATYMLEGASISLCAFAMQVEMANNWLRLWG